MKTQNSNRPNRPGIILLNQWTGSMPEELAETLGKRFGSCFVLTGHPDTLAKGDTEHTFYFPAMPLVRGNIVVRSKSWFTYVWQAFRFVLKYPSNTPILVYSNPPILCWLAAFLSLIRGQKFAVMVWDIYPNALISLGWLGAKNPIIAIWRMLNRWSYQRAQVVMTLGECMRDMLLLQFDPSKTKAKAVRVFYPWVDTGTIRPIPHSENRFRQLHNPANKKIVMYSGNMGLSHDIQTMLTAADMLKDRDDVLFLFVGGGPKWEWLHEELSAHSRQNVVLLPWQSPDDFVYSIASADIFLVSIEEGIEGIMLPSKSVSALSAGLALVVSSKENSSLVRWVREQKCGAVVQPKDIQGLTTAIRELLDDDNRLNASKHNSRKFAEASFSGEVVPDAIAYLLEDLFK